jgi:hypothetical protein
MAPVQVALITAGAYRSSNDSKARRARGRGAGRRWLPAIASRSFSTARVTWAFSSPDGPVKRQPRTLKNPDVLRYPFGRQSCRRFLGVSQASGSGAKPCRVNRSRDGPGRGRARSALASIEAAGGFRGRSCRPDPVRRGAGWWQPGCCRWAGGSHPSRP